MPNSLTTTMLPLAEQGRGRTTAGIPVFFQRSLNLGSSLCHSSSLSPAVSAL